MNKVMNSLETSITEIDQLLEDKEYKEINQLFDVLKDYSTNLRIKKEVTVDEAEKACNKKKNRYADILPFDETRVLLEDDGSGEDYINACWIKGSNGKKHYIAAQGPMQNTVVHFWKMLWQTHSKVIIMACNFEENKKKKCAEYWKSGQTLTFGRRIHVLVEEETNTNDPFVYRLLRVKRNDEERFIHHFHYTSWPDYGAPKSPKECLKMLEKARKHVDGLLAIHCSAGCGRTGALCAIDYCWSLMEEETILSVSELHEVVRNLRKQRQSMVQSVEQLVFYYKAIQELYQRQLDFLKKGLRKSNRISSYLNSANISNEQITVNVTENVEERKDKIVASKTTVRTPPHIYENIDNVSNDLFPSSSAGDENREESLSKDRNSEEEKIVDDEDDDYVTLVDPVDNSKVELVKKLKRNVVIQEPKNTDNHMESFSEKLKKESKGISIANLNPAKLIQDFRKKTQPQQELPVNESGRIEPAEIECNGKKLNFPCKIDRVVGGRNLPEQLNKSNVELKN